MNNKVITLNDVGYQVLFVLPSYKPKEQADTVLKRYSITTPAILLQSRNGEWVITRKVKDAIFTDIENINEQEEASTTPETPRDPDGIDNTEKD